ncbi:MAG: hypothetical protein JO134_02100 [Xanthobacteraceae bacterium]|nr:hypothetical protein [Xanthobacteraceae bacterium]
MADIETKPTRTSAPANAICGETFVVAAERALASGDLDLVPDAELERVLTAAIRLYAAKVDLDNKPISPVTAEKLTPTDVVVSVTGMIRAVGLNLWDLSMWFQRPHS